MAFEAIGSRHIIVVVLRAEAFCSRLVPESVRVTGEAMCPPGSVARLTMCSTLHPTSAWVVSTVVLSV